MINKIRHRQESEGKRETNKHEIEETNEVLKMRSKGKRENRCSQIHPHRLVPITSSQPFILLPSHHMFPSFPKAPHSSSHFRRTRFFSLEWYETLVGRTKQRETTHKICQHLSTFANATASCSCNACACTLSTVVWPIHIRWMWVTKSRPVNSKNMAALEGKVSYFDRCSKQLRTVRARRSLVDQYCYS
jgi:hypothetical protein